MIAEKFESFRRAVMPADAPDVQVECMRMAFWGGASAMFSMVCNPPDLDAGDEPTARDVAHMDALLAELEAYAARSRAIDATFARQAN